MLVSTNIEVNLVLLEQVSVCLQHIPIAWAHGIGWITAIHGIMGDYNNPWSVSSVFACFFQIIFHELVDSLVLLWSRYVVDNPVGVEVNEMSKSYVPAVKIIKCVLGVVLGLFRAFK